MIPFPDKKYQIIYVDPPWTYQNTYGGNPKYGAMPYETMSERDIQWLDIASLAANDCVLFIWATMPKLREVFDIINAWGFSYKTCAFAWVKQNPSGNGIFAGLGRWVQGNVELCLLATKGKPKRISKSIKQVVLCPRRRHSAKPSEVRNRIVQLMGNIPRIELFARERAEGWDAWGNEVPDVVQGELL